MEFHFRAVTARNDSQISFDQLLPAQHLWRERSDVINGSDADCKLTASNAGGLVLVTGTVSFQIKLACSKCLAYTDIALQVPVKELFFQPTDDMQLEEDDHIHAVEADVVQLSPYIEENMQLAIPFVPVCKADCKGLCAVCGTNLNDQSCTCNAVKVDPRLAGLAQWFDRPDDKQ